MSEPSGVYVRAICRDGRWDSVDALTLDEESFRRFILKALARQGSVVSIAEEREAVIPLRSTQEKRDAD